MTAQTQPEAKRKLMKRSDVIVIAVLLLLALGLNYLYGALFNKSGLVADIYYQNNLIESIELSEGQPREFHYEQNPQVVFAISDDASIAFKSSNCPDQVCVNAGSLHSEHAFAACLPNDFLLVLRSTESAAALPTNDVEVDIVN